MTEEQFQALALWIDAAVARAKGLAGEELVEEAKQIAHDAFCGKAWGQADG